MDIKEYLDKHSIEWFPINISIENYKKVPSRVAGYEDGEPWVDTWRPTKNEIEHMKTFLGECNAIVMDTTTVHHLDIDVPSVFVHIIRRSEPWYESFTKKLPHSFYIGTRQFVPGAELLVGRWAFAPKNALVHNFEIDIPVFNHTRHTFF